MWFISFGEDISVGPCESPLRAGEAVASNEFCLLKQVKLQRMQSPRCYLLLLKGTEAAQCQGKRHSLLPSVLLFPNRREYSHLMFTSLLESWRSPLLCTLAPYIVLSGPLMVTRWRPVSPAVTVSVPHQDPGSLRAAQAQAWQKGRWANRKMSLHSKYSRKKTSLLRIKHRMFFWNIRISQSSIEMVPSERKHTEVTCQYI